MKKQIGRNEATHAPAKTDDVLNLLAGDPQGRADRSDRMMGKQFQEAADVFDQSRLRLAESIQALVEAEAAAAAKTKVAVSRAKDAAGQLGDAMSRVNRILGPDFEGRLQQLERLAASLQILADLEKSGRLDLLVKAMSASRGA